MPQGPDNSTQGHSDSATRHDDDDLTMRHSRSTDAKRVFDYAKNVDGTKSFSIQRSKLEDMPERSLIGVDGQWYDVTAFKKRHPGGDIIEEYVGMDATQIFHAWHPPRVLAKRRPVGTYNIEELAPQTQDPFEKDMRALQDRLQADGFFDCDKWWWVRKTGIIILLLVLTNIVVQHPHPAIRYGLGVVCMTLFWQQSGFMMHDAMHSQHFESRKTNQAAGVFFGSICFGISGRWWRDEHYEHHSFTCTAVPDKGVSDPQFDELWATSRLMFPFRLGFVQKLCITFQDYIWIPLVLIAGRYAILIDSYKDERRMKEWAAIAVHWCVVVLPIYMAFGTNREFLAWYALASLLEGILHIQLIISHLVNPYQEKDDTKKIGWYRWQISSTYNITNPRWLDWFHGGLNFHMVHHTMPRMPRTNYVKAQQLIDDLCAKHGVPMYKASFTGLCKLVTENFRKQKQSYWKFVKEIDYRH